MKFQFKRIVSTVCALAMCASMMPTSALAGSSDDPTPKGSDNLIEGNPIAVELYVDGNHVDLNTREDVAKYLDVINDKGTPYFQFSTCEEGNPVYDYKYERYKCADLIITPASGYLVQGITADISYGMQGSNGIQRQPDGTIKLDNVNDGSTVKVYLSTPYTVQYVVDQGAPAPDGQTYAIGADLQENKLPDKKKQEKDKVYPGITYLFDEIVSSISLKKLTTSDQKIIAGWYINSDCTGEAKTDKVDLDEVKSAAQDQVITFYGCTERPHVAITKDITKVVRNGETFQNTDAAFPNALQVGDEVTYQIVVENDGDVSLKDLTVADTFNGQNGPSQSNGDFVITWTKDSSGYTGSATISELAVGKTAEAVYTYTVTQNDVGKLQNTVVVQQDDTELGNPAETTDPVNSVTVTKSSVKTGEALPKTVEDKVEKDSNYTSVLTDGNQSYINTTDGKVSFLYKVSVTGFEGAQLTVTDDNVTATSDVGISVNKSIAYVGGNDPAVATVSTQQGKESVEFLQAGTVNLYYLVEVTVTDGRADQSTPYVVTIGNTATIQNNDDTETATGDEVEIREAEESVKITKKITLVNNDTGTYGDDTVLRAGDVVTYTITVENTGNVDLKDVVVKDTINGTKNGLPENVAVDGTATPVQWQKDNNQYVGTWKIPALETGKSVEVLYTYTVQEEDQSSSKTDLLTNIASIPYVNEEEGSDGQTDNFVEKPAVSVVKQGNVRVNDQDATGGMYIDYTITVTNQGNTDIAELTLMDAMFPEDVKNIDVAVDGKTVSQGVEFSGENLLIELDGTDALAPGKNLTVKYTHKVEEKDLAQQSDGSFVVTNTVNVTAKTENGGEAKGEDTEETTVYAGTLTLTPAPIVIYTGGTSGQTIVDENGSIITNDTLGLPVLGFLFKDSTGTAIGVKDHNHLTLYDISGLRDGRYSWTATPYNENSTVLYQLAPSGDNADDKENVRIQLLDQETGQVWDTDAFQIGDYLYKQYTTEICTELGNGNAQVVAKVGNSYYKVTSATSTLTVRGTTNDVKTNQVVSSPENLDNTIDTPQAVVAPDAKYYYVSNNDVTSDEENTGDKLQVEDASSVSLLVDEIVDQAVETDQQYVQMMKNKAETDASLLGAVPADTARVWRFYYMDLVLADNGNAVLTSDKDLTIYWPYPEGITYQDALSGKYDFTVLHYTGLDRNYKSATFGDELDQCNVVKYEVTPTEQGLMFTVPAKDGFSPYALVYEYSTKPAEEPAEEPTAKPTEEPKAPEQTVTATGDDHPDIAGAKADGTWGQPTPTPAAGTVIPQTGDDMPLTALMGVAAVAAAALVVLVIVRRRRRKQ